MDIGIALKYGNKGDAIAVRLTNGKVINAIALNEINSSKVLVVDGFCLSETSPATQTSDRTIVKTGDSPQEAIACQLVASSIFSGLAGFYTVSPYNVLPYVNYRAKVFRPAFESWAYVESNNTCQAVGDGSGEYQTREECLLANRTIPRTEQVFKRFRWQDNLNSFPTNSNYFISLSINNFGLEPSIIETPNGDFKTRLANGGIQIINGDLRYEEGNSFKIRIRTSTLTWYSGSFISGGNPFSVTKTIFDGSVRQNGVALDSGDFVFDGANYTKELPDTYTYSQILSVLNSITFSIVDPNPSYTTVTALAVDFSIDLIVVSDTGTDWASFSNYLGFFAKCHDPNLPAIKVFETYSSPRIPLEPYYLFFGNKAYFICKIGKVRAPELPYDERPWFQIKVVEIDVGDSQLIKTEETDYFYPDTVPPVPNSLLDSVTNFYDNAIASDSCLSADHLGLIDPNTRVRFQELHYQKSINNPGGKVVYKVPGTLAFGD